MVVELIGFGIIILVIALIIFSTIRTVRPTERALIERFGKFNRYADAGLTFIVPFVDQIYYVNITEQMVDAEKQDVITKDNLNCSVDAQIYFKVIAEEGAVKKSQYAVDNYFRQIVSLTRTTLRDIIGKKEFTEVNSNRDRLNQMLEEQLSKQILAWGIQLVRAEIKEINPPSNVQATMNEIIMANNTKVAAIDFATATETKADGDKRATIKRADAERQKQILEAEGRAQAIKLVNEAAEKYFVGNAQKLESLRVVETALRDNTKFVVPSGSALTDIVSALLMKQEIDLPKAKQK